MVRNGKLVNIFETVPRPRTIKTHLPVQLLPDEVWLKKPKIIYISRDPRDVIVSNHHYYSHFVNKSLTSSLENFLSDEYSLCPYREYCLNYWNIPNYPNILHLTYESTTSNIDVAINKVAHFLGVTISDENFLKLKNHLQFDKMKSKCVFIVLRIVACT